jgi:hypothetical protein
VFYAAILGGSGAHQTYTSFCSLSTPVVKKSSLCVCSQRIETSIETSVLNCFAQVFCSFIAAAAQISNGCQCGLKAERGFYRHIIIARQELLKNS